MRTMKFFCKIGLHNWVWPTRNRTFVIPRQGLYDWRTEEERTKTVPVNVCSDCGKEREYRDESLTIPI